MPRLSPFAAGAALVALAACTHGTRPYVLGLQFPLTDGKGQPDVYGELSRMGAQLALDEINGKGGISGHPLAVRMVNDQGDDSTAIGVADSLAHDARNAMQRATRTTALVIER